MSVKKGILHHPSGGDKRTRPWGVDIKDGGKDREGKIAMRKSNGLFFGMLAMALAFGLTLTGCNTLQSIEVSKEPTQTVFGQGQELDTSGLTVMAHYKKDSKAATGGELRITGYNPGTPGKQTVTVTLKKQSATFKVTVVPVEKVTIQQLPATTVFMQGDDFNPAGLIAWVEFENGAVPGATISPEQLKFLGYDKNTAGTQTVTADYYDKKASFDVRVAGITGITVKSPPNNTTDYFTGEDLDTTGLAIVGTWEGIGEKPLDAKQVTLSGFNKDRAGKQDVLVTYQGKTASFSVTFVGMQAISVSKDPTRLLYAYGEKLDLAGLAVQGMRAGTSSTEQVPVQRLKISGYDPLWLGSQTVTVTIGGANADFKVTVAPLGTWDGNVRGEIADVDEDVNLPSRWILATLEIEEKSWSLRFYNNSASPVKLGRNKTIIPSKEYFEAGSGTYIVEGGTHIVFLRSRGERETAPDAANIIRNPPLNTLTFTEGTLDWRPFTQTR
jgi:hypothetical protein